MTPCAGCIARQAQIDWLQGQVASLTDKMLALMSPAALAVARGQAPAAPMPVETAQGVADGVDEHGHAWVWYNGQRIPLEEYRMVMAKADLMAAGG